MAGPLIADRVREITQTAGTGTVNLEGQAVGFKTFAASIGNGNTCYYMIANQVDWEVGIGTVLAPGSLPDRLTRDTVLASTNADALVNFPTGSKEVIVVDPAYRSSERWAKVTLNPGVSIATATLSPITWSGPAVAADNPYALWSALQPTRLTANLGGLYVVELSGIWAVNASGDRLIDVFLGGVTRIAMDSRLPVSAVETGHHLLAELRLASGQYVEARVLQSSGAGLLFGGALDTFFSMRRVGTN